MASLPQIIIWLDATGVPHVEAPGANGQRQKLDITVTPEQLAALRDINEAMKERERTIALERNRAVFQYVADTYGESFARRTVGRHSFKTNDAMYSYLRSQKFTPSEIALMQERGELNGTAFFSSAETEARHRLIAAGIEQDTKPTKRNPNGALKGTFTEEE